jgi:hypothetical protein
VALDTVRRAFGPDLPIVEKPVQRLAIVPA